MKMLSREEYLDFKKIKRTKKIIGFSKVFLFLFLIGLSVVTVYNFDLEFREKVDLQEVVNSEAYLSGPDCVNLSFQDTAVCLNNFARKYFFYNVTDDDLTLDVQEMMDRGGDCGSYTDFYERYMEHYGYGETQRIRIFVSKEEDISYFHVFLIASHSSGYCHMDIRDLECFQYANDDGEVKE